MFKQNKTKEKLSKTIMVFLFLLFLLSRNTALNPCYAQFTSSSQEFNNASTVAQTFKDYYSGVDYATFNGEEFEQGFIDTCSLPKYGGLNNCQHMARVPAKGAVDHAFIYKINGNPDDLAKAKYLIGKMVNLYDSWKTINSVDFHSWSLNAGVSYALGLASWIIWDEL
ncbi:MAG: hypothetical protein KJ923_01295, partial [Candidatus Omnitrophica bacterium]|nr:hypothetical protein [Candidatus Omnitrophota bacterium]